MHYRILVNIILKSDIKLWEQWYLFRHDLGGKDSLKIELKRINHLAYGLEILEDQPGKPILKSNDCILCVNSDWTEAKITLFDDNSIQDVYKILNALLLTHLSTRQTIEIHASLIQIDEKGIMFLGPSEIGKTTQAELWMQYRGAEIINGDMVFIKREEDRFFGCGSPWHGSSPYCLNKQVSLSALIVLKQSKQNTIRRLTGFEMVSSVMSSVFWPTWYREGYEAACETFDTLLNTVPVYELSCRPDEDAVKLTEETIFGK